MDPKYKEVLFYRRVMFMKYIVQIETQNSHSKPHISWG